MKKAIVIMAKFPEAGRVKTRLQPFLSTEQSAEIALAFLQDAENKAKSVCKNLIIAFSPPEKKANFKSILQHENILIEQAGANLGERMFNAFEFAFSNNSDSVVIIGTDSPTFSLEFIKDAFEFLKTSDAVLGETADGGYYLIGLDILKKEIFENVEWSSEETFEQTVRNIENLDLKLSLLPKWYDVDFPEDLKRLKKELGENSKSAPKTAGWIWENVK